MTAPARPTRRQLAARGIAAWGALAAGPLAGGAPAVGRGDAGMLAAAIAQEQRAAFACRAVARSRGLDPALRRVVELIAGHERRHADGLTRFLRRRGGRLPAEPTEPRQVPGLERALRRGGDDLAGFLLGLESAALAGYADALGELRDPRLISIAGAVMASEGQHLALLHRALGREPVPSAFVTGGEPRPFPAPGE